MKVQNFVKSAFFTLALSSFPITAVNTYAQAQKVEQNLKSDVFERGITPQGVKDKSFLKNAPSPNLTIAGEKKTAGIVIDLSTNILYRYDKNGKPINAYLIASGKKSTPTHKGVRIVTHKETFPYKTAPRNSKRRRSPRDYGPFIICLDKLDTITGMQSSTGEFIHGCRDYHATFETVPGRYVSHGCMRMDNDVITTLSKDVKRGEIVIIK